MRTYLIIITDQALVRTIANAVNKICVLNTKSLLLNTYVAAGIIIIIIINAMKFYDEHEKNDF